MCLLNRLHAARPSLAEEKLEAFLLTTAEKDGKGVEEEDKGSRGTLARGGVVGDQVWSGQPPQR